MLQKLSLPSFLTGLAVSGLILFSAFGGAVADRLFIFRPLDSLVSRGPLSQLRLNNAPQPLDVPRTEQEREETVIAVTEQSQPSVVTVSIKKEVRSSLRMSPFGFFAPQPGSSQPIEQDIGTGFVVDQAKGLVVTNRHVVGDGEAQYRLIDKDGKEHEVQQIYRDPANDLAILKTTINTPALPMANSDDLKIGQSVIAIGTALGEFRQTVTTGIVSGLGRGIEANDGFASERIDNLIQTDAAINPGNSGGPLLNSRGEVIGVNVAMAQAENIGFAIPINVVKESLQNFQQTGEFNRPLLGLQYKMIPRETALLNDVPEGAYVSTVIGGSTSESLGIQPGDIITEIDAQKVSESRGGLAALINRKKVGDTVKLTFWRSGESKTVEGQLKGSL